MALGDILRFKDGRNMPDVHATLFRLRAARPVLSPPQSRLRKRRKSIASRVSKGILEVTEFTIAYFPAIRRGRISQLLHFRLSTSDGAMPISKNGTRTTIPSPVKNPSPKGSTIAGASWDEEKTAPMEILPGARENHQQVTEDTVFGHNAALACHMANESFLSAKSARHVGRRLQPNQVFLVPHHLFVQRRSKQLTNASGQRAGLLLQRRKLAWVVP